MNSTKSGRDIKWIGAHLYYNEHINTFLHKAVYPFACQMLDSKIALQFFFIRYFDLGYHIRLRFKGEQNKLHGQLKPKLEEFFNTYMGLYPSMRANVNNSSFYPNNSIQWVDYEPEIERYGGYQVLPYCELYFQASSFAVLRIMQAQTDWSYSARLGSAIQLHLGLARASNMNNQDIEIFFSKILELWIPSAANMLSKDQNQDYEALRTLVLNYFEMSYQQQFSILVPYIHSIWNALKSDEDWDDDWFNEWLQFNRIIDRNFKELAVNGYLEIPNYYSFLKEDKVDSSVWYLYESLVHMTNNRLGITNQDEGFIAFLIKKAISLIV